jgi:hypothetical protein
VKAFFGLLGKIKTQGGISEPASSLQNLDPTPGPHAVKLPLSPRPTDCLEADGDLRRTTLKQLIRVTERFPRDYDYMYRALLEMLRGYEVKAILAPFG